MSQWSSCFGFHFGQPSPIHSNIVAIASAIFFNLFATSILKINISKSNNFLAPSHHEWHGTFAARCESVEALLHQFCPALQVSGTFHVVLADLPFVLQHFAFVSDCTGIVLGSCPIVGGVCCIACGCVFGCVDAFSTHASQQPMNLFHHSNHLLMIAIKLPPSPPTQPSFSYIDCNHNINTLFMQRRPLAIFTLLSSADTTPQTIDLVPKHLRSPLRPFFLPGLPTAHCPKPSPQLH